MVLWDEIFPYVPDASAFLFRKHLTSKDGNNVQRNNKNNNNNNKTKNGKTQNKPNLSYFSRSDLRLKMPVDSKGMYAILAHIECSPHRITHKQNKEIVRTLHTTVCREPVVYGQWFIKYKIFGVDLICYTFIVHVNAIAIAILPPRASQNSTPTDPQSASSSRIKVKCENHWNSIN